MIWYLPGARVNVVAEPVYAIVWPRKWPAAMAASSAATPRKRRLSDPDKPALLKIERMEECDDLGAEGMRMCAL
jgi:hypothetical protein